jgi:hypothetical protein
MVMRLVLTGAGRLCWAVSSVMSLSCRRVLRSACHLWGDSRGGRAVSLRGRLAAIGSQFVLRLVLI